jgi:putative thioredoxin
MTIASQLDSPYIFEGSRQNFHALVLENSNLGPVLVNYWAAHAAPCLRLYPVLDKLVHDYEGKFLLVNLDVEQHRGLAREYGVSSLPTMKLFRHQAVVETLHGYQPAGDLQTLLNKYVARESDAILPTALTHYAQGQVEQALSILARAALEDPDNLRLAVALAKLLIREHDPEKAQQLLRSLPEAAQSDREVHRLLARLEFLVIARDAPESSPLERAIAQNPNDLAARYSLSAVRFAAGDPGAAMEQLLEIMGRDRSFHDDAGRRGLLAIFEALNNEGDLVSRYRTLMKSLT